MNESKFFEGQKENKEIEVLKEDMIRYIRGLKTLEELLDAQEKIGVAIGDEGEADYAEKLREALVGFIKETESLSEVEKQHMKLFAAERTEEGG
ncbi:MAG: hypothetical protein NT136_00375 [Candidatus Moranbacteria bacterium]|nr:hypothetical protein [Candidatus Moranbacteria bacterium]